MNNAIQPHVLYQIIDKNYLFIDIRDSFQFDKLHIKNFYNLSINQLLLHLQSIPKNKPIILMCYSGKQTKELSKELNQQGYNSYYIIGGFQAFLNNQNNQYY